MTQDATPFGGRMRRLAMILAGAVSLCLAGTAAAQQQQHNHHGGGGGGGRPPMSMRPPASTFSHGPPGGRGGPPMGPPGRGGPPTGFDPRRYNGYWVGQRWYYGEPPAPAYEAPGFRPGFTPWTRGSYLPPQYQNLEVIEYWRFHLRRPPAGYHWVQVGDQFLLVSLSTSQIFDVVTGF